MQGASGGMQGASSVSGRSLRLVEVLQRRWGIVPANTFLSTSERGQKFVNVDVDIMHWNR